MWRAKVVECGGVRWWGVERWVEMSRVVGFGGLGGGVEWWGVALKDRTSNI